MLVEITISATEIAEDMQMDVVLDQKKLLSSTCKTESQTVTYDVPDDAGEHCLQVVLSNKLAKHTCVDNENQILTDVMGRVDRIVLDEIDCTDIFCSGLECYQHNINGNGKMFTDQFYGLLGCNGTASFEEHSC